MRGKTYSMKYLSEQADHHISTMVFIAPSSGISKSMHSATSFLNRCFWISEYTNKVNYKLYNYNFPDFYWGFPQIEILWADVKIVPVSSLTCSKMLKNII